MRKPKHELVFDVSPTGDVKIEVNGMKGKSCKDATREFEEALGEVKQDTPKKEMYEQEDQRLRTRG